MKLMRKIALIFISVTIISSMAFFALGAKMIEEASRGELDRGPGRTGGALNRIQGEVNQLTSQAREFGEYFSIASKIEEEYGAEASQEIINIKGKLEKAPINNMIIVDENFNIIYTVKAESINLDSEGIKDLLRQSKDIMNSKENIKKGFFGGIIGTEEMPYIVGAKRINHGNKYLLTINPMDASYVAHMDELTARNVELAKSEEVEVLKPDMEVVDELDNNTYYCYRNTDTIDIYTEFKVLGDGPKYYIRLTDDREVKNNATKNINTLVYVIIIFTILANSVVYIIIKRQVLKRIININEVVNKVSAGTGLNVSLNNDDSRDEISSLTVDLNNMFKRLKVYADNLEYIGEHDILTDLMNRNKLNKSIKSLIDNKEEFSLIFIDLDNFKGINDTLGHNVGDELLCTVAKELNRYMKDDNIKIGRIGGDEFVVIRKGTNNKEELESFTKEMLDNIHSIYEVNKYSYEIKASMGISCYPQDSEEEVNLFQYADIAMYCSKEYGGNRCTFFEPYMLETLEIESKIKCSLENNEFKVYFQPIHNTEDEDFAGAEALIRWETKNGIMLPYTFIQLAKKTGDIVDIDNFVLTESIKMCRICIDKGLEDFYISINASKGFLKQKNLVQFIKRELEKQNVPASAIKLEITEDEVIDDLQYTIDILNEIKKIGIKIALDDFGTGYSSFNHIKILPVDIVKIDRSFIIDIQKSDKDRVIVDTMIDLCHSLNIKVICEGVEEDGQVQILKKLNCDSIQGYYFNRPLEEEKFMKLISDKK